MGFFTAYYLDMNYFEMLTYDNNYSLSSGVDELHPVYNWLYSDGTSATTLMPSAFSKRYKLAFNFNSAFNRAKENNKTLVGLVVTQGTSEFDLFIPSAYDYALISFANAPNMELSLTGYQLDNFGADYPTVASDNNDYLNIGLIDSTQYFNYFNEYQYYQYVTDLYDGDGAIYDFTNLYSDTSYYTRDNWGVHTHFINLIGFNTANAQLRLAVGSPYSTIRDTSYSNGYSNGYLDGENTGYQNGFNDGLQTGTDRNTASAFDYIGKAFSVVAPVLELEILPHITLGLAFSIPLTFTLILLIFKLVKK